MISFESTVVTGLPPVNELQAYLNVATVEETPEIVKPLYTQSVHLVASEVYAHSPLPVVVSIGVSLLVCNCHLSVALFKVPPMVANIPENADASPQILNDSPNPT